MPFDGTTSYMPGARFGPRSVREASYNFEKYNLILDKTINTEIYDFGDLEVVNGNFKKTCSNLKKTISDILDMGLIPLTIGGDHSISCCVLKAIDEKLKLNSKISQFYISMHIWTLEISILGEKYSHATVMHRIHDMNPKEIIQIGVRSSSEEEVSICS